MGALIQPSQFLTALLAWSGQVFVLAAIGAIAALAITHPKTRLLFWQGLLLVLLLLPAIEPWKAQPVEVETATDVVTTLTASPVAVSQPATFRWHNEYWLWIIAAGAAFRMALVGVGMLKLRRYRRQAERLAAPPLLFASEAAGWYASGSIPGPVTYGWRRPVILLPSNVLALPSGLRDAIECHELIHVRRGDWMFVVAEAVVRSLLWFHPAVWLVLSRIQLAREQAVDREAIDLLGNREAYLDALVAVAGYQLQPELAPAPLFLRKRHLLARVDAVVKEIKMSRSRIVAASAVVCSAVPLALFAAAWLFPFVTEAQTAPDGPGIVVNPGATLLHRSPVRLPESSRVEGTVILQATLDANGEVTDAHVLSGPEELRRTALASVLQWHYKPGPTQAQISIQFGAAAVAQMNAVAPAAPAQSNRAPAPAFVPPPPPPPAPGLVRSGGRGGAATPLLPAPIESVQFMGLSAEAEQDLRRLLPFREGDTVNESDVQNFQKAIRAFDSHLTALVLRHDSNGVSAIDIRVIAAPGAMVTAPLAVPGNPTPVPAGTINVGGNVQAANLLKKVTPVYPPIAKQARIQGTVNLQAIIAPDGTVANLSLIDATSPLLVQSAMDAVRQWVYKPTLLNGEPARVVTTITVNFSLQ